MDCLRSWFACCRISEEPVAAYCPLEQALSHADEQRALAAEVSKRPVKELVPTNEYLNRLAERSHSLVVHVKPKDTPSIPGLIAAYTGQERSADFLAQVLSPFVGQQLHATDIYPSVQKRTVIAIHTCKQILTLVASYCAEKEPAAPKQAQAAAASPSPTFLQNLLITTKASSLKSDEIPSADLCTRSALKNPETARITIKKHVNVAHLPHLSSFKKLQFIWIRDCSFLLSNIPLIAQLQGLVGIDITMRKEVEDALPAGERHNLHTEFRAYGTKAAARLFEKMPVLAYVHIRDEVYVRWDRIASLSACCRTCILAQHPKAPPLLEKNVVLLQLGEHENVEFSQLDEKTTRNILAPTTYSMQTSFGMLTLRQRMDMDKYSREQESAPESTQKSVEKSTPQTDKDQREQEQLRKEREDRLKRVQAAALEAPQRTPEEEERYQKERKERQAKMRATAQAAPKKPSLLNLPPPPNK